MRSPRRGREAASGRLRGAGRFSPGRVLGTRGEGHLFSKPAPRLRPVFGEEGEILLRIAAHAAAQSWRGGSSQSSAGALADGSDWFSCRGGVNSWQAVL